MVCILSKYRVKAEINFNELFFSPTYSGGELDDNQIITSPKAYNKCQVSIQIHIFMPAYPSQTAFI